MGRKVRRIVIIALLASGLALVLGSCSLLGVTIMDRISSFGSALNASSRTGIESNFDPSVSASVPASIATNFPVPTGTEIPYSITLQDYSNPSNVTASIIGPTPFYTATTGGPPASAVFTMVKIGNDWYIEGITVGTVVIP